MFKTFRIKSTKGILLKLDRKKDGQRVKIKIPWLKKILKLPNLTSYKDGLYLINNLVISKNKNKIINDKNKMKKNQRQIKIL